MWLIFSKIIKKDNLIVYPLGRGLGCLLWCSNFDLYSASVAAVIFVISCYIVPRYNSIRLCFVKFHLVMAKQTVINMKPCDSVPTGNFARNEGFRIAEHLHLLPFGLFPVTNIFYCVVNCFVGICLSSQILKQEMYVSKTGQYGVLPGWFVTCDTLVIAKLKIQLTKINLNTQSVVRYGEITLAILNEVISHPTNAGSDISVKIQ